MNYSDQIMYAFGGLALFLFGIELMSNALKNAAGNKLKTIIEKSTNTPLKGIIIGIILTGVLQSSTAVTVLMIGLLRAGLMTLPQSIGLIMGANIGTAGTAFIIGLPIAKYGLFFLGVGVVLTFIKKGKLPYIGGILTGLGMLFFGLNTMSSGLRPIADTQFAVDMFQTFSQNWFLGSLFGTVFTGIIQSSTAVIAILQDLYHYNAALVASGAQPTSVSLMGALPILLGANVGTTLTALFASLGGNIDSRRAAWIHVIFNVFGTVLFLIFLHPYHWLMQTIEDEFLEPYSIATLAHAQAIQNFVVTIVLYFLIPQQVWLVKKIVKDPIGDQRLSEEMFDEKLIQESPSMALVFVKKALIYMGSMVKDYFDVARVYSFKENSKLIEEGETFEMIIDSYDQKLHDYLIKIAQVGIGPADSKRLSRDLDTIRDFERIGDHLTNIMEFFQERYRENQILSEEGSKDLQEIYDCLETMLTDTLTALANHDVKLAKKVIALEDRVDQLEEAARYRYIERLKNREVVFVIAANYADILANLERIGDHLMNIASSVIEPLRIPQSTLVFKHSEEPKEEN